MLNTENNKNNNNLDLLYQAKFKNIQKNYDKIKQYFILILTESNSKLNTYAIIYNQIKMVIEYNNKYNSLPASQYLYFDEKYRNSINALIIFIIIKEIELEDIRLKIFTNHFSIIKDIHSNIKSYIGININKVDNFLVNIVYPKLLSILEEAKDSFKTIATSYD